MRTPCINGVETIEEIPKFEIKILRESLDHKLIICRNWKTRDKRKMLVKVTFVQVRVLLLLGSENYISRLINRALAGNVGESPTL